MFFRLSCVAGITAFNILSNKKQIVAMCDASNPAVNVDQVLQLRPTEGYIRIGRKALENPELTRKHALHDALNGEDQISVYEIYENVHDQSVQCLVKFGDAIVGHPGVVHGGVTSLLFDNTFGWVFIAKQIPVGFTANLNVNFRRPVFCNTYGIIKARIDKVEGRKIYLAATLTDVEGNVLADATALFISPNNGRGGNFSHLREN